ncbi:MAG: methionine adenosyltransferase [Candidatus Saccharimonadales bacterium]|nr:methionine adenosyltransferase [Candidatus Saccharimonadales bacterium]
MDLFTSESVCSGHADKICDQISDAIVDEALRQDPHARVAVEAAVKDRIILIGETNTTAKLDYAGIARTEVKRLGYTEKAWGFTHESPVEVHINHQSEEIAQGSDDDMGAGDQGLMFGYACQETPEFMPMPITLAHGITKAIDDAREDKTLEFLRPDGKSQVTVKYQDGKVAGVEKIVLAVAHSEDIELKEVTKELHQNVIEPVLARYKLSIDLSSVIVNGTGAWHIPGPANDAGLTGRKIVVDGYGGMARVGGGAFSGKDPSKVDRSGAYAARYLAKNLVAAGLADRAEVALAYCIGIAHPLMQTVETFGTAKASQAEIEAFMHETLDTSVKGIIDGLDLRRPIYKQTAAYGHFGKKDLPWEKLNASESTDIL